MDDFLAQSGHAGLDFQVLFLDALGGPFLQVIEGVDAVFGFGASCAGHAAHPVQFGAQQVARLVGLGLEVLDPLFPFLQEVGVIAGVAVQGAVCHFQNLVADSVQEITVVGDHQQGTA